MSVFQPLLGGLVASDREFPGDLGNVVKVLPVIDPDTSSLMFWISDFIVFFGDFTGNRIIAVLRIGGDVLFYFRAFQQRTRQIEYEPLPLIKT